jgi:hypothetical protein
MGRGPFRWPASGGAFWPSTAALGKNKATTAATTTAASNVNRQPFLVGLAVAGDNLPSLVD